MAATLILVLALASGCTSPVFDGPDEAAQLFVDAVLHGDTDGVETATGVSFSESEVADLRSAMFDLDAALPDAEVRIDGPQEPLEEAGTWGFLVQEYVDDGKAHIVEASDGPVYVAVDQIRGQWRVVALIGDEVLSFQ